ncbi:MAG: UDP-N-acetylmuramoyl-L-alanine--D-glutamate ligase [Armatimonadota bacterium]|nr:UDP-N-acetylmuramoyl-L-alanine--D-glutamate ligase [Armatimonadota bacterium]MDR7439628.1 UDP-N-acetylmuramoyl-L-alanine--D-glutamate ligase [Armatimonadota bacterium]MDR7563667.1 UDP-N-acetylmuramoyl-L-alanine--D-glutamate ligase [Armatimonadota bacterium]MDR7566774.1 UDP-N-acetylmuramoyl-L-alanine--D-glutamate ligase [Armatimonadota bacterium]MDR7601290.1 UDP-N-acetylmuramoyl-L-alanine--D-glutamate ligase [Armatimonadota bacterium]
MSEALALLRGRRIHVLGLSGTEGSAVASYLLSHGIRTLTAHDLSTPDTFPEVFRRTHVWMPPEDRETAIRRWLQEPIPIRWRDRYLEGIEEAEVVFLPQAWFRYPENEPIRRLPAEVERHSMTRLVFQLCPCPVVGITGTNGKFTVGTLLHRMLLAEGKRAHFSGNDRTHVPLLHTLDRVRPEDWVVLEISNRQLLQLDRSPQVAVLTNLAPHHLDDHGSFEAYVACKATIFQHQTPEDVAILDADDPVCASLIPSLRARLVPFAMHSSLPRELGRGAWVDGGWVVAFGRRVLPLERLPVSAEYMVRNALAACAAAGAAGVGPEAMGDVLRTFRGLPHRLERVAEVGGVECIEDSLATNPAAAAAAIRAMRRPFVLIAGGRRPGATPESFAPMREALRASPVRAIYLIGECAEVMRSAFRGLPAEVLEVGTLPRAVRRAVQLARPGEAVLFSPGCESFDQFRDYRERAEVFQALVRALAPSRDERVS